jgi:hypothetical protein
MPIITPKIDTDIKAPMPSYSPNEAALKALLTGVQEGAANSRATQKDAYLEALFKRKEEDKSKVGEEHAIGKAHQVYKEGLVPIQKMLSASAEGLQAISDPKQVGSLGQARTLALKAFGMNRYNQDEAKAVIPAHLQSMVAELFNKGGGDESPLDDSTRRSTASLFRNNIQAAKEQHDILKKNALANYGASLYSNPDRATALGQTIGAPTDEYISQTLKKFQDLPDTHTPAIQRPAPTSTVDKVREGAGGIMDSIKSGLSSLFHGPAASPVAPQTSLSRKPQALIPAAKNPNMNQPNLMGDDSDPTSGDDMGRIGPPQTTAPQGAPSFEEFKRMKKAGLLGGSNGR